MRILVLCQFFAPDITAAAFRMSDFARLLAEAGDEVRVITSYPHKSNVASVDDSDYESAGIRVSRCHVTDVIGGGAKAYLRHYFSFVRGSLRLGFRAWREGWRPDVIYASSPPLFVGVTGRVLSLLFWRPMVLEIRDIWPDAAVSAGQLSADGRAYRIGRFLERYLYRKATHITCVAQPMRDYLLPLVNVPVTVVYNGIPAETELPDPTPASPTPSPTKTLLYAGNLGHVQQLELLLSGFSELLAQGELTAWRIELLGGGAQQANLAQIASKLQLQDRVTMTPAVSRSEASARMRQADVLYLHLMGDQTMERTIPSKVFDYLLAARPILAGLAGEGAQILSSTGANVVFQPGDVTDLKRGLRQVTGQWPQLEADSMKNRHLVLERFTRQKSVQVLRQVFESVT